MILSCSAQQVNFMLSGNDVEVDDGDYHQRTALHLAASNGHIAMVRHLVLIHGANMNVLDRSAQHTAASRYTGTVFRRI